MLRSCVGTSRVWVAKLALALVSSTPSRRAEEGILFMSSALVLCLAGCEESQSSTGLKRHSDTASRSCRYHTASSPKVLLCRWPFQAHGCEGDGATEQTLQCVCVCASSLRRMPPLTRSQWNTRNTRCKNRKPVKQCGSALTGASCRRTADSTRLAFDLQAASCELSPAES